ncbi:MAG: EAL domain-containing protein [Verrucomicrobia bacterium]|nr:EAL domain-containing protein [Verrucomicrobiota bacterium]
MGGDGKTKILYAEDDLVSARMLGRTLEALGYEVRGCSNGREALELFAQFQPQIIISDWMMPEVNGLQFCSEIRKQGLSQYTYFIVLTANTGESNYRMAMDAGVDDFLSKPLSREELQVRLRVGERIVRQRWKAEAMIRSLARFPADNPNPVLQANRAGMITYANKACLPLLNELGCSVNGPLPPDLRTLMVDCQEDSLAQRELSCRRRTYSFAVTSISEEGLAYIYGHDITDRKRAETELITMRNQAIEQSLQDVLTGIGNRVLFQQQLPKALEESSRSGRRAALVFVDIDNFKEINDGHGHKMGDQVIIHVAHTLRDHLKASDSVCRWGGDELVVVLSDLEEPACVSEICERLSVAVRENAAGSEVPASLTLSMGYSVYPDDADTEEMLLQRADQALYKAKADGRNCIRGYSRRDGRDRAGMSLFQRLTQALKEERMTAFFQPVWDVVNNRVAGVESLARWHDPDWGFVPPDEFIPVAERKGLIVQLSRQVLRCSLMAMSAWRDAGFDLTLSVNLSKRQLVEPRFLDDLREQIDALRLPHYQIIFEVTERQSILGNAVGRQRLEEMEREGYRLSLDDFGSGYSSFDLVGEIPFQELKIYSGLINRMEQPRGRGIVQAVVDMGHTLGLTVVAEGVEHEEQVVRLRGMGIHKIQGYYYSKPLSLEQLLVYLKSQENSKSQGAQMRTVQDLPSPILKSF